jgi:hypothetical protein
LKKELLGMLFNLLKKNYVASLVILIIVVQQIHIFYLKRVRRGLEKKNAEISKALGTVETDAFVESMDSQEYIVGLTEERNMIADEFTEFVATMQVAGKPKTRISAKEKELINILEMIEKRFGKSGEYQEEQEGGLEVGHIYRAMGGNNVQEVEAFNFSIFDDRVNAEYLFIPNKDITGEPFLVEGGYRLSLKIAGQVTKVVLPGDTVRYKVRLFELDTKNNYVSSFQLKNIVVKVRDLRANKFRKWAPKLDISLTLGGLYPFSPVQVATVGFSPMGYGLSKRDLSWRFLRTGVGLSSSGDLVAEFTPALYNIGKIIPGDVIHNSWFGPSILFNKDGFNTGLTLNVSF